MPSDGSLPAQPYRSFREKDDQYSAELASMESSLDVYVQNSEQTGLEGACVEDYLSLQQIAEAGNGVAWTKLVCNLMSLLFTHEELLSCVISRKSNCQRAMLDEKKVNAIVNYVTRMYPLLTTSKIRFRMSQKCKDVRVCHVRRLKDPQRR